MQRVRSTTKLCIQEIASFGLSMDKLPVTFDPLELVLLKQYNSSYEDFHFLKPILFDSFVYCGLGLYITLSGEVYNIPQYTKLSK